MKTETLQHAAMTMGCPAAYESPDTVAEGKALIALMLDSTPEEFRDALRTMQDRIDAARSPDAEPVDTRQLLVAVMRQLHRHMGHPAQ